ncbi:MAG: TolB family protein, partial [Bryobacteraceae bacterium]
MLAVVFLLALAGEPAARMVWNAAGANVVGAPSLDGKYLSCVDPDTGDLALRGLATGEHRRLTRHARPGEFAYFSIISPDSRFVAYAWFNAERFYELRLVGIDGTGERVLYRNEEAGFVQPSAFSPDGKQILTLLFRKDNISQIALVPVAGGPARVLKSLNWVYPKKMDFSPDGRFIVYDNFAAPGASQRDVFALAADGSRETRLVENPAEDLFPVWSPDGRGVVFASNRAGSMDAWWIGVEDGRARGEPRRLRRDVGRFLPMGLTRAGAYYYGLRSGASDIWIAGPDGAGAPLASRYAGRNSEPQFSPDGARVAYLSVEGSENFGTESRLLSIQDVKTGRERHLAPKLAHFERLRWSPDAQSLLAGGSDGKGRAGLFRIDAGTGA